MFCEVILSRRFPKHLGIFDYKIPPDLLSKIKVGQLVTIPFRKSEREGVVIKIKKTSIAGKKIKPIEKIIQNNPILTPDQILLAQWMADYYFLSLGTIIKTILPPSLKKKMSLKVKKFDSSNRPAVSADETKIIKEVVQGNKDKFFYQPTSIQEKNAILFGLLQKTKNQILIILPTKKDIDIFFSSMPKSVHKNSAIIHSGLNKTQYHAAWQSIINNKAKVIIGTKLALFSPVINPAILILDQEDNQNHKQADQNPRFDSQQVLHKMSEIYKTKLLFINQSMTVDTYYQTIGGKFISLKKAEPSAKRPITIIDMKDEQKKKNYSLFSDKLQDAIAETLQQKKQIFLFINKRGSSSSVICRDCGLNIICDKCQQPLAYHSKDQALYCHQCNKKSELPPFCSKCNGTDFKFVGTGTQKVENEINKLFPDKKTVRIDQDAETIKNLNSYNIIIGTELALPFLKWESIGLVGIVSADTFLYLPDFRSTERTWHLLNKLAFLCQSDLIIQTYSPRNPALKYLNKLNKEEFYKNELKERQALNYPPFSCLIKLIYSNKDKKSCLDEAQRLYKVLKTSPLDVSILTPLNPFIRGKWQMYNVIKFQSPQQDKLLKKIMELVPDNWIIDRDPISLL